MGEPLIAPKVQGWLSAQLVIDNHKKFLVIDADADNAQAFKAIIADELIDKLIKAGKGFHCIWKVVPCTNPYNGEIVRLLVEDFKVKDEGVEEGLDEGIFTVVGLLKSICSNQIKILGRTNTIIVSGTLPRKYNVGDTISIKALQIQRRLYSFQSKKLFAFRLDSFPEPSYHFTLKAYQFWIVHEKTRIAVLVTLEQKNYLQSLLVKSNAIVGGAIDEVDGLPMIPHPKIVPQPRLFRKRIQFSYR